MFRCLLWATAAAVRPKVLLIAENLCLRQQLLVLQRRKPRPRLKDADRRFWLLACPWFVGWRASMLIVKPETVLRWHRHRSRTYWRWRSSRHLEKVLAEYVGYFKHWRPNRSIGQRAPCAPAARASHQALKLEKSSQYLCLEAFLTFISRSHDVLDPFLRPTGITPR